MRLTTAALVCFALARPVDALTVRALSLDELVGRAARVVHARCLAVTPAASVDGLPVLEITLGVTEALKGPADERLVIRQLGGAWSRVLPPCVPGDEVVLFLHEPSRRGLTSPVGMQQGHLRVVRPPGAVPRVVGPRNVVRALAAGAPAAAASARTGGTAQTLAVPL
ncbi:MAG TPA: hypothetical protein VNO26_07010, partial [Candidatus Limnocylindria bacterium]|nr:hypothetical protein [Candidatus Limnocylindria bacterium]